MDTDKDLIKILKDLASTCRDAEEGYNKAAKGARNEEVRTIFDRHSVERARFAAEWDQFVREEGDEPGDTGHGGGPLGAGWVDLEQRIRPKDDNELLHNAAKGEEGGIAHFEHAMEVGLPDNMFQVADRQLRSIRKAVEYLRSFTLQPR
jgi:uncharacterized protein (TIGR02284 family)